MKTQKSVPILIVVCVLMMFATPAFAGIFYVKSSGTGGGASWANAANLQAALSTATSGDEIWVAAGTYKPTTTTDRIVSFVMKAGVKIYGGFAGTETTLAQRDWENNTTILSGDIDPSGDNDSYHVVNNFETGLTSTAILDGFTITGGNANSSDAESYGGGMFNYASSPTVANCTFSDNSAGDSGGGMFNFYNDPTVTNCTFSGNTANWGGGMYNSGNNTATVTDCTFSGNSATDSGGGIYNDNSSPAVSNCTFSTNTAVNGNGGGGMYNYASSPAVSNCVFSTNTASNYGGGIFNDNSMLTIENCVFSTNTASNSGGGMFNGASSPTVSNCVFSTKLP